MKLKYVFSIIVLLTSGSSWAHDYSVGSLLLKRPIADETRAGQRATGVYLEIRNESAHADRLVAVSSSIAEKVALHQVANGSGGMSDARYLTLPGKGSVVLAPGASHIMLMGLRQPLRNGERFPLKLVFERSGAVLLDVLVVGAMPAMHHAHQ